MLRFVFKYGCAALCVLMGMTALPAMAQSRPTRAIRVGCVLPMTGPDAERGKACENGIRLAAEEVNIGGGVLARHVDIIVRDSASSASTATIAAKQLISDDLVDVMIGDLTTPATLAAGDECQKARIPLISPACSSPKLDRTGKYVFRTCVDAEVQGAWAAEFAARELNAKRAAVMYAPKNDESQAADKGFTERFAKASEGGRVVVEKTYVENETGYKNQLSAIAAAKVDVVFLPASAGDAGVIVRQARQAGVKCPIIGAEGWNTSKLLQGLGDSGEQCYFVTHCDVRDTAERVQRFVERYKSHFQGIDVYNDAILGYDAARTMFDAINRATKFTGPEIRTALTKTSDLPTLTGLMTIDKDRVTKRPGVVMQIKDGEIAIAQHTSP